ncbi:MAG: hypothetical protein DRI75_11510 [Bacteroidetes bacterium]|nr:MAG: hypothetical protein DRI75_11510 [Bacteroidota bacterium]
MKAFIKNIASVFLAFLVLFSTMSFTISEHYCGDIMVDRSLFSKAESCGMDSDNYRKQKNTSTSNCSITKMNCCENVVKHIEGQDDLKISFNKLTLDQQLFVATFVYAYINLFEGLDKKAIPFNDYSPPLIVKDIHILDEVFLI